MKYFFAAFVILCASVAFGDEYRPAYLEIKQTSDGHFDLLWKVPATDRGRLDIDVRLPDDVRFIGNSRPRFIGGAYIEHSRIYRAGGLTGANITILGIERLSTDVLLRIERLNGSSETARLNARSPTYQIKGNPDLWQVVTSYLLFGTEHILEGFDHLLFVACLVFIAGTWRRILVTITGFTLAHSITLSLASLNLVRLPLPPVEAVIALSIVFLAREIVLKQQNTLTWRYPIAVSASFGLLHGFGFASALAGIGLPQTEISAALLAFNLGVELGQILFVFSMMILASLIAQCAKVVRQRLANKEIVYTHADQQPSINWLRVWEKVVGYSAGAIAMFWTLQRLSGF